MAKPGKRTIALVLCMLLTLMTGALTASAEVKPIYATPPEQLAGLSQEQLNAFGMKLLTEAYTIRSRVGSPTGEVAATPELIDPAAVEAVRNLYDDDALIQRARLNYGLTKQTYNPHDIDEFTITDMAVSRTSDTVLVISFNVKLPNRTSLQSGIVMSGESMPRLLVMRWSPRESMWKIFSHADFDVPAAVLCGSDSSIMPPKSRFNPADIEFAKTYLDKIQTASLTGTEKSVQAPGFQYVFASGERKTAPGKIRARITKRVEPLNVEAIKSDDLMVVRFDTYSTLQLDGGDVEKELRPRLITFHKESDGEWRMNAIGIFSVTAKVAKDTPCRKPKVK